jgi:hypothetical protein
VLKETNPRRQGDVASRPGRLHKRFTTAAIRPPFDGLLRRWHGALSGLSELGFFERMKAMMRRRSGSWCGSIRAALRLRVVQRYFYRRAQEAGRRSHRAPCRQHGDSARHLWTALLRGEPERSSDSWPIALRPRSRKITSDFGISRLGHDQAVQSGKLRLTGPVVSRSLSQDVKRKAKTVVKPGYGDKGDQKRK